MKQFGNNFTADEKFTVEHAVSARRRKPAPAAAAPAPVLYSLTGNQARWLASARDTSGGAYVGITAGPEPYELVEAGLAVLREVRKSRVSPIPWNPVLEWTARYLVPTERGLELLRVANR